MTTPTYDIAVLGAGPGGYVAAIRAAQLGLKVAIIEREHLGGVCLNWGCIPTKALLRNAEVARLIQKGGRTFGFNAEKVTLDYAAAVARSRKISARLVKGVKTLLDGNGVDIVNGEGHLESRTAIAVTAKNGDTQTVNAKHIILATGSRARTIPGMQVDGEHILSAREALERRELPNSAVIIGAGPIGLEFATLWSSYGTQVTVVEMLEHVLPAEDEDAAAELARHLKRQKIKILTTTKVEGIHNSELGVEVQVSDARGESKLAAEVALMAIGVRPNSENLGLEALDIATERGWVKVDDFMRTTAPNIYAIGDLNGLLPLAHVASAQGILAVETIAGQTTQPFACDSMPRGTYTTPQVASFGLSEAEAADQGIAVHVGKFPFLPNGKALGLGENSGFVKIIAAQADGAVLGAVIVGPEATELLPELVLASRAGLSAAEIAHTVHAHPTLNEVVMEAAHGVFGKTIHML